ncbi:MAG: hypothetical protein L0322_06640 [Chloroflexi bacterium]|nr:hypothetical protein [Chloroflexota bacterium]
MGMGVAVVADVMIGAGVPVEMTGGGVGVALELQPARQASRSQMATSHRPPAGHSWGDTGEDIS